MFFKKIIPQVFYKWITKMKSSSVSIIIWLSTKRIKSPYIYSNSVGVRNKIIHVKMTYNEYRVNLYPKLWTFSQADKATSMVSQNKLFSCEGTLSGQEWNNILKLKWVFVNHKWNSFIYTFLSPITNNVKFWILSDTLFYTGLKLQQWNFWTAFLYCSAKYILKHHKRFVISL